MASVGVAGGSAGGRQSQPVEREYRIVDLGPLGFLADPDLIGTFDINDRNEVAFGGLNGSGQIVPKLWRPTSTGGEIIELPLVADGHTWTSGIAFDINDDGIVVGQVGGHTRAAFGSRAAVWDLNADPVVLRTIAPQSPPSGQLEAWQNWTRAIAVSEGSDDSVRILVETWDEVQCRSDCGFEGPQDVGVVGTAVVSMVSIEDTQVVQSQLLHPDPGDCWGAGVGRDIRLAGGTEVVGSGGLDLIRDACTTPGGDPCNALRISYRWENGSPGELPDLDGDGPNQARGSQARGIGGDGAFVGWGFDVQNFPNDCFQRPLLWESAGADPVILPHPGPSLSEQFRAEGTSGPRANGRLVVGWNSYSGGGGAVRWHEDGQGGWTFEDLSPSGSIVDYDTCSSVLTVRYAFDVSVDGWIVGAGLAGDDSWHSYLLVPLVRSECPEDIDGDGEIGLGDLLIALSTFYACPQCLTCAADINGDRSVDFVDLLAILAAWGECGGDPGLIPQTVSDCFQKFGSDPIALEACLSSIGANQ